MNHSVTMLLDGGLQVLVCTCGNHFFLTVSEPYNANDNPNANHNPYPNADEKPHGKDNTDPNDNTNAYPDPDANAPP